MKVLLVQPPTHSRYGLQNFVLNEPLGLELIAAGLQPEHEVDILDMRLEPALHQKLYSFKPDTVGVSACFTSDVYNTFRVLEIVKEHNRHIFTFVGGQHATMSYSDFWGRADAVVLGEGELTTQELIRCRQDRRNLDEVSGLALFRGDTWIKTIPRALIHNLDQRRLPARSLISKYLPYYFITTHKPIASIETSRGCPHKCKFCSVWRFFNSTFRTRSSSNVVEELRQIECQEVLFTDDSALSYPQHSLELVKEVREAGINKRYTMQIRADTIVKHKDILAEWRDIGLESVFVGFESINQSVLDELGKRLKVANIEEAIDTLRNLDIALMGSFIVNPDFNKQDFAALKQFVRRMKLRTPAFSILTPLPGTVLYEEKADEITSHNYELYDLLHATLPTKLGLKEFYKQFVRLYISSYSMHLTPSGLLKPLIEGRLIGHLSQAMECIRLIKNNHPGALVKHHRLPPGKLSEVRLPGIVRRSTRSIKKQYELAYSSHGDK